MIIRHFVDATGRYIGAFGDGATPPSAAIEIALAPDHADQHWTGEAWVWPIEHVRAERLLAVDARYRAALEAGMAHGGKPLQICERDQQNIVAMTQEARLALATGSPWPADFAWRMADNSFLTLASATDMVALGDAAKAEISRLRQVKWRHVDAIAVADSVAAILSHDISNGW